MIRPLTGRPVAVIGAGTMGAGIAQVAAAAGHAVWLHDLNKAALEKALNGISKRLDSAVAKGRLDEAKAADILKRIIISTNFDDLAQAGLVIEAIVERLDVKRKLFAALQNIVDEDAVLASNTSSLSITAVAQTVRHPGRVIGLHFFNPPPLMKLVEVVEGIATAPEVRNTAMELMQAWGKQPVLAKSTPGFIVNRVARPFYGEALRLAHEKAASIEVLDAVLRDSGGFRMGPFELIDLIGLEVSLAVTQGIYQAYSQDPRYKPSLLQEELVAAGHYGRKTGRGFYIYGSDAPPVQVSTAAAGVAPASIRITGKLPQTLEHLIQASGVKVVRGPIAGVDDAIKVGGVLLRLTDGITATAHSEKLGRPVVLFDLALDYERTPSVVLARGDQVSDTLLEKALGLFTALGKRVYLVDDIPGLVVLRTWATLANEASDAVHQGVASATDVDIAMLYGVNYPQGPLQWVKEFGPDKVVALLDALDDFYRDGRYRASPLLRRQALIQGRR